VVEDVRENDIRHGGPCDADTVRVRAPSRRVPSAEREWRALARASRVERAAKRLRQAIHRAPPLVKAGLDRAVAAAALVALSPLLGAVALAVRLDSPGPVLYRQERIGYRGRPFALLKFRSMVVDAERHGLRWEVASGDARITRAGRRLRQYSLDELPQLVNVLRGEMSLVGPRPTLAYQVARYTPHQRRRLEVKPGLTGWAQVNGRNAIDWDRRIELDVWYVDHWSLALDLRILLRTPAALLAPEGVYGVDGWVREKP
jgi:exopolysaccharide biosynthesis polyprenyl glycosylphosphotransferase